MGGGRINELNASQDSVVPFLLDILATIMQNSKEYITPCGERINNLEEYLFTYSLMADEYSRKLYMRIIGRMLANEFLEERDCKVLFPVWSQDFAQRYEQNKNTVILPDLRHPNDRASQIIFPETFYMPAYEYHDICMVEENDTVFDIGAWIGDTAYVFSEKMNGTGKIHAFEPMPQNYEFLSENAKGIPNLDVHNIALGKEEGTLKFAFGGENSGASRQNENGTFEVKVTTLDDFVASNHIEKVDFIKADIEGAECDMLLGASETIKRCHPKLAICIYHRGQIDHFKVPEVILSIRQDYEFYVEAYKDGLAETVLFGVPVDYIPERQNFRMIVDSIKKLYTSVHDILWEKFRRNFLSEFHSALDKMLKKHFTWQDNELDQKLFLKVDGMIHYKLLFRSNDITVELVFDKFAKYQKEHREYIDKLIQKYINRVPGYRKHETDRGQFIRTERPYHLTTPEDLACNMAVLIKETVWPLWEGGIIDAECIRPLLYDM